MKLSQRQKIRLYSHYDHHLEEDEDFWTVMGILITIMGLWTGFIHLLDYFTFDMIQWWAEPFTIIPVILFVVMKERPISRVWLKSLRSREQRLLIIFQGQG